MMDDIAAIAARDASLHWGEDPLGLVRVVGAPGIPTVWLWPSQEQADVHALLAALKEAEADQDRLYDEMNASIVALTDAAAVPEGREPVELNVDPEFEPDGEAFGFGVYVHVERMDKGVWWMRIERKGFPSALVGHLRSKSRIHAMWEWEPMP